MNSQNNNKFKKKLFTSNVVDVSYLTENLSDDVDMLKQMIQLFLVQSPEKIAMFKKSVIEKDFNSIRETSHFLLSTFNIMGLKSKNELIEIELLSTQQKDFDKILMLTQKVLNNFDESESEYKKIAANL